MCGAMVAVVTHVRRECAACGRTQLKDYGAGAAAT